MAELFDTKESPMQEMTFGYAEDKVWEKTRMNYAGIADLLTEDGKYSNLALMLSDQCPWSTEITVCGEKTVVKGSILKQYYAILESVGGIGRRDPERKYTVERYPMRIVREAAVNAVVHRDYSTDSPIKVEADLSTADITSPGGIWVPEENDGKTIARNSGLARFFRVLEGFGFCGNGIASIKRYYRMTPQMPSASYGSGYFTMHLPAISAISSSYEIRREKIEHIIDVFNGATVGTIAENTMLSPQYTRRILKRMEKEKLVFCIGCGRKNVYYLCSKGDSKRQGGKMR